MFCRFSTVIRRLLLVLLVLRGAQLTAQNHTKITGPLGFYHLSPGYTYADSSGVDSVPVQQVFKTGEMCFANQADDDGFTFKAAIDSCEAWHANKILGIIQPVSEDGVKDKPTDTALYTPLAQVDGPGMLQGAQRFSWLSQLYGGYSGIVVDDWKKDTALAHRMHAAIKGKSFDANGNVIKTCPEATPRNKLYVVLYLTNADATTLPYVDGVSYWNTDWQNYSWINLDRDIDAFRVNWPHKEILIGIYIYNSHIKWADPFGVHYMLSHALDRYDDGDINGITLFPGTYLAKNYISLAHWNAYALPHWLDSLYYPYLGAGQGLVHDCASGKALSDAFINVYCRGRVSGDTMMRSRQMSDANGQYQFGVWAGNRNTDSTFYWIIAEKTGYKTDTISFWIKRNKTTLIPPISLCPLPGYNMAAGVNNLRLYPNPTKGGLTIMNEAVEPGDMIEVFNLQGIKVYSTHPICRCANINLPLLPDGIYLVSLISNKTNITRKGVIMLTH